MNNSSAAKKLGEIVGTQTGETDQDTVAGGWQGTDDATSTAPSDLIGLPKSEEEKEETLTEEEASDAIIGRASAGGMPHAEGGVTDIKGSPVEESRDWKEDPI